MAKRRKMQEDEEDEDEDEEEEAAHYGELVTEAEGYQLFLSSKNACGYKGVWKTRGGRFEARKGNVYIGMYDTALEAAVGYAKHVDG